MGVWCNCVVKAQGKDSAAFIRVSLPEKTHFHNNKQEKKSKSEGVGGDMSCSTEHTSTVRFRFFPPNRFTAL